jgi:hypothetical protein
MCHLTEPGQVETTPVAYHDIAECKAALRRSRCYTTQHDGEVPLAIKDGTPMDPLCDRNATQLHDNECTVPIVVPKVRSVARAHSACCAMQALCVCGGYLQKQSIALWQDMEPPIFVYYQLSGLWQNHRRYIKSRRWVGPVEVGRVDRGAVGMTMWLRCAPQRRSTAR